MYYDYTVHLIHRYSDWDARLTFRAPDARTARKWALGAAWLAQPDQWIIISARRKKV